MPDRPINCTPNQFLIRGFRQGDDFAQPLTITWETANGTQARNLANLTLNFAVPSGLTMPGASVTAINAANGTIRVEIPASLTALWSGDVFFSLTGTDAQGHKTTLADVNILVSHYPDCIITDGCECNLTASGGSAAVGLPVGIANLTTPGLVKPDGLTINVQPDGTIVGTQLVPATNSTLGGIIVGSNLSITGNGVLSANIPPGGVETFNGRTGNVTVVSGDITGVLGNTTYLEVRPFSGQPSANYPTGTQSANYGRNAQYTGSPLYQSNSGPPNFNLNNTTVGVNSNVRTYTACTTSANTAVSTVGNFDVTFQTFSYDGILNRTTGFRLSHFSGVPYLSMIGQPQFATYADVNAIGIDYLLTKSQMLLLFYTRQQIDQILLNYQRIN